MFISAQLWTIVCTSGRLVVVGIFTSIGNVGQSFTVTQNMKSLFKPARSFGMYTYEG